MLTAFIVQNFKSILNLRVDFSFHGRAPRGWQEAARLPFIAKSKKSTDRIVPVLALYGANAAGKSSIIQALLTFCFALDRNGPTVKFLPNRLNRKYTATTFQVEGSMEGIRYRYGFSYNGEQFLAETLELLDGKPLYTVRNGDLTFSGISEAGYDIQQFTDALRVTCFSPEGHLVKPILSVLLNVLPGINGALGTIARDIRSDISAVSMSNGNFACAFTREQEGIITVNHDYPLEDIARWLNKFDFGIKKLRLDEAANKQAEANTQATFSTPHLQSIHNDIDGNEIAFQFLKDESEGTKRILSILLPCLEALKRGTLVAIDELDQSLHPFVLVALVRLFTSKRLNPYGARLLFTVHDTILLENDLLRPAEIGVIAKTPKDGTTLSRICDFEGQTSVRNFRRHYLDGIYGGIPFPYI